VLPEGARLVQKKTSGTLGTLTEQWLIEQQGVFVRTADAGGYARGILEAIIVTVLELMQQADSSAELTLNVTGHKFHRVQGG
jgi:hypothetical protein